VHKIQSISRRAGEIGRTLLVLLCTDLVLVEKSNRDDIVP
jgi:hypothetical protein